MENLRNKSMDECKLAIQTRQDEYDDNNWNKLLEDIDLNDLTEHGTSWGLLMHESITPHGDNVSDVESTKLIHLGKSNDCFLRTISTINESEQSLIDDENDNDESSDSDTPLCLKTLATSDLNIKLHKYQYPIPDDPGLVPSFWSLYPKPSVYEHDGVDKFKNMVGIMKLQPIQRMAKMLRSGEIDLKHYGVNPKAVRAICEATFNNTTVKMVDLQDNWLTIDACFHLNDLLLNNNVLSCLNLSGCRIGPRGAKRLQEGIGSAPALRHLDISRCDLGDEGLTFISTGIYCSSNLQIVNLGDNKLGDGSGLALQTMLTQSDSLRELNLSWNTLFGYEFWKRFIGGLSRNVLLTHLDLSCNSLGKECSPLLVQYLSSSPNLHGINLKGNKFTAEEAMQIAEALMKNTTLEVLDLGNNPIEDVGANAIIRAMTPQASPHSHLCSLDLENIWASKDILPMMQTINNERPMLHINLGGILSNYEAVEFDIHALRKILLKRANYEAMKPKLKKNQMNFGQFVLSLDNSIISTGTFRKLVKQYKLKLRKSLVTEIMNAFAIGEDAIDQGTLKTLYLKEYPDTYPVPLKPKKKKKKKKKTNTKTKTQDNKAESDVKKKITKQQANQVPKPKNKN